jgi:6-phosphofructokinase 1
MATSSYFIVETMGRKAGWLSYGVAIAGEAHLGVGVEDVAGDLAKQDGIAEGLAEMLTNEFIEQLPRDDHGHIPLANIDVGRIIAANVARRYEGRTGRKKKVSSVQLGYESRCATPHAFDIMLGSQLGIGAYRGLVEEGLDAHMVSVTGQLDLRYVPFKDLVNMDTMKTEVRYIQRGSDFHRLARFLETRVDPVEEWSPGRRQEH